MKQSVIKNIKLIAIGAIVISLGALGVVGGGRTVTAIKHWVLSIFDKHV